MAKTPQEKKRLSYEKDRRNNYRENSKSSRKNIPLNKRIEVRAHRHVAKQALAEDIAEGDLDATREAEARQEGTRHPFWQKWPDTPLGEMVEARLEGRAARGFMPDEVAEKKLEKVRRTKKKRD
jgi:hypothetical protein